MDPLYESRRDVVCTVPHRRGRPITDTELKLMAAAAMVGLKRSPNAGYSTPAASGIPTTL
jgi:hypothetical protein